jgi:pullulanase
LKQIEEQAVKCLFYSAEIVTLHTVMIHFTVTKEQVCPFVVEKEGTTVPFSIKSWQEWERGAIAFIQFDDPLELGVEYKLRQKNHEQTHLIKVGRVVRTEAFDQQYVYNGELGALYSHERTVFAVWTPVATEVSLLLYENWHTLEAIEYQMKRSPNGVWSVSLDGDLHQYCYLYRAKVNGKWKTTVDPYAKSVTVNGEKGVIFDLKRTDPASWPTVHPIPPEHTIIYELHIRDATVYPGSGHHKKGTYLSLAEQNTCGPWGESTGLSYIRELGVTHLELLPVADYGSVDEANREKEYNWGYDVVHYFAPEGSYASDPYDGVTRVKELKQLIAQCQRMDLRVILDVVFNHVYVMKESPFEKLVPGYYFRYDGEGNLADGTGVGNDIASERLMVRKFIVDCVTYWASEYRVDGFRFDLMGIIDQMTMKEVKRALAPINRQILLLGEGWDLETPLENDQKTTLAQARAVPFLHFFHDTFRDAVKGSTFDLNKGGFCAGNIELKETLIASMLGHEAQFDRPSQAIQYVEAHDNHTLWDKLQFVFPDEEEEVLRACHRLATAIVLTSQGIPFLHGGQEFFRTKHGEGNSYNSPDWINQLDWSRRAIYAADVEYVKGLIALRKAHRAFCFSTFSEVNTHMCPLKTPSEVIGFHYHHIAKWGPWDEMVVLHNGGGDKVDIRLPASGEWEVIVDGKKAGLVPLYTFNGHTVSVQSRSSMVLYRLNE